MSDPPVGSTATFGTSCLSCLASGYLLVSLWRLPVQHRKTLLARQLQHLAAADLLYAITEVILSANALGLWPGRADTDKLLFCQAMYFSSAVGFSSSAVFECHLAIAFAASFYKSPRLLGILSRILPFGWLCTVALAVTYPFLMDIEAGCTASNFNLLLTVSLIVDFAIGLASYIVSSYRVRKAGVPVQRLVWLRARGFLFVSCLTTLPYAFDLLTFVPASKLSTVVHAVSKPLFDLNGFFNLTVYALLNREARRLLSPDRHVQEFSYAVTFRSGADSTLGVTVQSGQSGVDCNSPGRRSVESAGDSTMVPLTEDSQAELA